MIDNKNTVSEQNESTHFIGVLPNAAALDVLASSGLTFCDLYIDCRGFDGGGIGGGGIFPRNAGPASDSLVFVGLASGVGMGKAERAFP